MAIKVERIAAHEPRFLDRCDHCWVDLRSTGLACFNVRVGVGDTQSFLGFWLCFSCAEELGLGIVGKLAGSAKLRSWMAERA